MNMLNGIPMQWLILGLFGFMAFQTILTLKLMSKSNQEIDRSFQTLARRFKTSMDYTARNLISQVEQLEALQTESFKGVDAKLSRVEMRSLSDATRVKKASSSPLDRKHQVVSLAQMGLDSKGISRRLRLSQGEAELLLGLKERYSAEIEDENRILQ